MRITKYLCFSLALASLSSCLDENPLYSLNSESTFEDVRTAELAMKGCYGYMTTYDAFGQAGQELLSGASGLGWAQTSASDQDRFASMDASSACVITKMFWSGMYKTISECCFFIHNMEKSPLAEADKAYLVAQAKFLRGLAYYNLVTTYGGVPLRVDAPTSLTLSIPRASEEEVYAQIEKDWMESAQGLKEKDQKGLASRPAAYAYLAKLYWTLGSKENNASSPYWKKAQAYCDSVYQKGGFALERKFENVFVNHYQADESIFQLNFSTSSSTTGNRGNWIFAPQNSTEKGISWGRIRATKAFHDLFKGTYPTDPRYDATFLSEWVNRGNGEKQYAYPTISYKEGRKTIVETLDYSKLEDPTNPKIEELSTMQRNRLCGPKGENNGWAYFKKSYDYVSEAQNCNKNLILYRYADFLLLMADVENELGNTSKAIGLVNQVLSRARNSVTPAAADPADWDMGLSQDQVRTKIYYERLFELAGEPTMYMDVRRRGGDYIKSIAELNNRHHITYSLATSDTVGIHKFRDRIFNNGNISADFLKKNLVLPIPQEEINTNELISVKDQNFGY
ncbi:MAG: RagB/SusD family nutrient uptake outer membrane protein [Bacteroidales bacterium]